MDETCKNLELHVDFCGRLRNELRQSGLSMVKEARVLSLFQVEPMHLAPLIAEIKAGRAGVAQSSAALRDKGYMAAASLLVSLHNKKS